MGDDEADCDIECISDNQCPMNNDVNCLAHPVLGHLCRCHNLNYEIKTEKTPNLKSVCRDFNECNDPFRQHCSFQCKNMDGGFNCSCPSDFILNPVTFSCEKSLNDVFRPNLLLVLLGKVNFYNIGDVVVRQHPSSALYKSIEFPGQRSLDLIQYDSQDHFLIYYNREGKSINCRKQDGSKRFQLISDVDAHQFTYDSEEKSLFILESQRNTLDFYGDIKCDHSYNPQRHSWKFARSVNIFKFIDVDYNRGKLFFASEHQLYISNLSQPNQIQSVHLTKRSIERVLYDKSFQRFFWTTSNTTNNELFPLYTCDGNFQLCHDTFLRLPNSKLFAFFNDNIVYGLSSLSSLEMTKIFGKTRFSTKFLLQAETEIDSLIQIDHRPSSNSGLCPRNAIRLCPNAVCYRHNRTGTVCLPIDNLNGENHPSNTPDSYSNEIDEPSSSPNDEKSRHSPVKKYVFIVFICGFVGLLFFIVVKRRFCRFRQILSNPIQPPMYGENLTISEPILDEFNVFTDDPYKDRLPLTNQLQY